MPRVKTLVAKFLTVFTQSGPRAVAGWVALKADAQAVGNIYLCYLEPKWKLVVMGELAYSLLCTHEFRTRP